MNTRILIPISLAALVAAAAGPAAAAAAAAAAASKDTPKPAAAGQIFPDDVLTRGQGIEVKRSELDEAFLQFKANLNARGQLLPEERRDQIETQLLDRLVITKLLLSRASEDDRKKARAAADKFIAGTKEQAGSEESFTRQLNAMNFTPAQFDAQVLERAVCEEVVDRELKSKVTVTDAQIKKYYDDNNRQFERPESVRAAHILLSTRDPLTNQELSDDKKKEKKEQLGKLLERARKGEDFAALAKEYSDDPGSKNRGGEYTFGRGQMVSEFEAAAFALKTNQVSDVVTTQFGYHIIKLYEHLPAQKLELDKVRDELKEQLARTEVQEKMLPEFLRKLKTDAALKYLNGAKPPPDEAPEAAPAPGAAPAAKNPAPPK